MAYYVGDIPADDLVIEPVLGEDPLDLSPYDEASVTLTTFDGTLIETSGFVATIDSADNLVSVEWPDETVFASADLFAVNVTLNSSTTAVIARIAPAYVVVQDDDGWHTVDTLRTQLSNDFSGDDAVTWTLLECAKQSVLAYAPALGFLSDGVTPITRPPVNYKQGQLLQARNILNISKTDPQTSADGDLFVIRPYPLDNFVKQVLRPRSPLGFVG